MVVGIGKYSDLPEARFAQRDAEAVKEHLIAAGFPSRNVIQLFGEKAGRSSMEKFVETWLPRNVKEDSRVFFYFSGHGAPDPKTGEAYLIPWDGDPAFIENTGYPVRRLYEKLSALKAKEVVVAMDSCFSGAGGRSVLAKGARPLVMKVDAAAAPRNLTVFAAVSGEQITSTLEDQGHGTFTYHFLKGLSGAAKDGSGAVTAKGLYDYLKPKVQDAARRQNRDQEPVLHGSGDGELVRF
ncbi:MAG: caspase family protein [Elusimicrobia bacterium]|nr:caspase family protein [Elusimicrobiota bacterium]